VGSCTTRTSTRPSASACAFEAFSTGIAADAAPVAIIGITAQSVRVPLPWRIRPQQGSRGCRKRRCDHRSLRCTGRWARGRRATSQRDEGGAQSDPQACAVSHESLLREKIRSREGMIPYGPFSSTSWRLATANESRKTVSGEHFSKFCARPLTQVINQEEA
jgi:hypothetical protein